MFELVWPWLLAFMPLPFVVWKLVPKSEARTASLRIPFYKAVTDEALTGSMISKTALALAAAAWLFLVVACARPVWIEQTVKIPVTGRDLLIAMDLSGSMETADFANNRVTRFDAVRQIAGDFIERRVGDRVGLIVFGSQPYLYAPLTFDVKTVVEFLNGSRIGFAGKRTAIGDTIALASKVLRERSADNRILILMTDGENSAGTLTPSQSLQIAVEFGVRIFVIGIGPDHTLGSSDRSVNVLPHIAETTGGRYFHAANSKSLEEIYRQIDAFEPIEADERSFTKMQELYPWSLATSMLLFLLLVLHVVMPAFGWQSVTGRDTSGDIFKSGIH